LLLLLSSFIVGAAVVWAGLRLARELAADRQERVRARSLELLSLFAPAIAAASDQSRLLLTWQPLAASARALYPAEFELLDTAAGSRFPFSPAFIEAAHAQWSADWLAWERTHDADYKLKAAMVEAEMSAAGNPAIGRARLEAVEREKLELYQRRYAEYVRISKGLERIKK
jgi:hypothetical protein